MPGRFLPEQEPKSGVTFTASFGGGCPVSSSAINCLIINDTYAVSRQMSMVCGRWGSCDEMLRWPLA